MSKHYSGFTLVELSIVLVIIGLLIGGILVGQSLIDSARITAQITQIQQFDIAANQYFQKFKCIPGDCTFHAVQAGNGDGILNSDGGIPSASPIMEHYNFFKRISDFGFYKLDHIIPVYGGSDATHIIGLNYPKAAIGRGGISTNSMPNGDVYYFLGFNIDSTTSANRHYYLRSTAGIFSTTEALSIDKKMDDGLPNIGEIASVQGIANYSSWAGYDSTRPYPFVSQTGGNCVSGGNYRMTYSETDACRLVVKAQSAW